jgi:sulfate transport system substrate-binding protein
VVPDQTILIENPVATTTESEDPELAQSFVDFLYTDEAQKIFVGKGYRPVVEGTAGADKFREPPGLFDIAKFGGWEEVNADFFDPEQGVVAKIFQSQGKSTASG